MTQNTFIFVGLSLYKGVSGVETLIYDYEHPAKSCENLSFLFLSLCFYLFKNCPSMFLSHQESDELVFCSEEFSCLPYKSQNKNMIFSSGQENLKFALCWKSYISVSSTGPPLNKSKFYVASEVSAYFFSQSLMSIKTRKLELSTNYCLTKREPYLVQYCGGRKKILMALFKFPSPLCCHNKILLEHIYYLI